LYVADGTSGLVMLDLSNPSQPVKVGQYRIGGTVRSAWVNGNVAYLTDWTNGLYAVDISNPAQIDLIDHSLVPGRARDVRYQDGYVYLAAYEGGFRIYSAL